MLDFRPWEGAYNLVREDATAFAHRAERFLLEHDVVIDSGAAPDEQRAARDWLARSWALTRPWGTRLPQLPDLELGDWLTAYHGANGDRLSRVKAAYDPDDVFRFHQSLPVLS